VTVLLAKRGFISPGSGFLRDMQRFGATDAWDFVGQSYLRAGVVGPSGITFTRASVGSYLNNNNTMTVFSSGQPRIGDKGILIEGSRQNLFLNSAVGATQSITVTAAAHTLSFFGTGTVTLSGVSTAGPLVGTGEFNRVSLTFTPTAGSLTLTVSGDIKWVNLELGSFPSSWIPSDGTAVTRAADIARVSGVSDLTYPLSLFARARFDVDSATNRIVFQAHVSGSDANRAMLRIATNRTTRAVQTASGSEVAAVNPGVAITTGTAAKIAGRFQLDNVNNAVNGTTGTADTSAAAPSNPTMFSFGVPDASTDFAWSYLMQIAVIPSALTDAQLQAITT